MAEPPPDAAATSASDATDTPVAKVQLGVPRWFRRVGTNSWLFVGTVIALAMIIAAIAATRDITVPLAIGILLAIVFLPIVNWLADRGITRALGSVLVLVGLGLVIGGAGLVTIEALADQSDVLRENLDQAVVEVKSWAGDLPISADAVNEVNQAARDAAPVARDGLATWVATFVNSAATFVAGLILGIMILYYLLKDAPIFIEKRVARDRDPAMQAASRRLVKESMKDVQGYFRGTTGLALANGASIALGVYFLGVPGALAIGVVNFVGAYIPYIGAFIGGAFAVLMALGDGGIELAVAAFAVVMVAQVILENLLQPKLLGSGLNVHPLTILLVTTLGGMVAGIVGLILAAPVFAIGRDLLRELKAIGFFDEGDELPQPVEQRSRG